MILDYDEAMRQACAALEASNVNTHAQDRVVAVAQVQAARALALLTLATIAMAKEVVG